MTADEFSKPTALAVGDIQARCPKCRKTDFVRAQRQKLNRADSLVCAGCGEEYFRSALMQQITDRVIAKAQEALAHAHALGKATTLSRVIDEFGSLTAVAKALGVQADELRAWHSGKAEMPDDMFEKLRALSQKDKD